MKLDLKAVCSKCTREVAGRLHFDAMLKVVDSDGGVLFDSGWRCNNCLGEPWLSSDLPTVVLR